MNLGRGAGEQRQDGEVTKPLVRSGWSSRTNAGEKTGKGIVKKATKDKVMMKGGGSSLMYDLEGNVTGGTQNSDFPRQGCPRGSGR